MVVYEKTSRFAFHLLHEEKSKVRLSQDVYKHDGNLQELPMQRTFNALQDFIEITKSFKTTKLLCVATSALRDAPNKKYFLDLIKKKLNLNIKIINGEKEAYYGAIACLNLLPKQEKSICIDIGGGSTELSFISNSKISHTISLKLGTVRLKELFFDKQEINAAVTYIDKELEKVNFTETATLVGIGGTFRAISNAIMKESNYPLNKIHAYEYSRESLLKYIEKLLDSDEKNLKKLHIKQNRYDVIKPGALILQCLLKKINVCGIITSGVGVREGVYLADLLRNTQHKFPNNFNTSIKYLLDTHVENSSYSNQLSLVCKNIFDLTKEYLHLSDQYRYELAIAAKLYPIGSSIHLYSHNKHTYYILKNALEYGFTHNSTMLIATLTKFSKNKLPTTEHLDKYKELLPNVETINSLCSILSLAVSLLSHRPRNIDFTLTFKNNTLRVNSKKELYIADYTAKKIESDLNFFDIKFNS